MMMPQINLNLYKFGQVKLLFLNVVRNPSWREPSVSRQEVRDRKGSCLGGIGDDVVTSPRDSIGGVRSRSGVIVLCVVQGGQSKSATPIMPTSRIDQSVHERLHEHSGRVLLPGPPKVGLHGPNGGSQIVGCSNNGVLNRSASVLIEVSSTLSCDGVELTAAREAWVDVAVLQNHGCVPEYEVHGAVYVALSVELPLRIVTIHNIVAAGDDLAVARSCVVWGRIYGVVDSLKVPASILTNHHNVVYHHATVVALKQFSAVPPSGGVVDATHSIRHFQRRSFVQRGNDNPGGLEWRAETKRMKIEDRSPLSLRTCGTGIRTFERKFGHSQRRCRFECQARFRNKKDLWWCYIWWKAYLQL
ncbi:hypothetical protein G2W53_043986 [Senna tora]|uniref:Uncharacterized protein n=1 Tax=Senna tora TaxID=362788 RepID=A0A834W0Y2_9FABA|nr:hypothetical protein G2W53_043986 [Senna tora]